MRRMRWLLCGLAVVAGAQQASAADMPDMFLRGSSTVITAPGGVRWEGIYAGAHAGMVTPGADFTNDTNSVLGLLRQPLSSFLTSIGSPLGATDTHGAAFGGFVGYNAQWDDAVVGVEANYNFFGKDLSATNFISGTWRAPDGTVLPYTATGTSTLKITDYGTIRARAGWAAGSFMPYATLGVAVGRGDINRTVVATPIPPTGAPPIAPITVTQSLSGLFAYGYAAGLGVDYAVMNNFFVRAEYEYVQFGDFQGLNAHLHNLRVGAAVKF